MDNKSVIDDKKFWQAIEFLTKLNEKESFSGLCFKLNVTPFYLKSILNFLNEVNYHIELEQQGEDYLLSPPENPPQFEIKFSLSEWLMFQAHFPAMSSLFDKPYHNEFAKTLSRLEDDFQKSDLFGPLNVINHVNKSDYLKVKIETIEKAILLKSCMHIILAKGKILEVFPHKLIHLDSYLSIVGEDISDNCLSNLRVTELQDVTISETKYNPVYSDFEVDSFITSLRSMADNTVRLILRIHSESEINLNPKYQFLDNSTIVMSPDGDKIWAATVEINEDILNWLFENKDILSVAAPMEVADILKNWPKFKAA